MLFNRPPVHVRCGLLSWWSLPFLQIVALLWEMTTPDIWGILGIEGVQSQPMRAT